jgi:Flp pilus assembly protein TadG
MVFEEGLANMLRPRHAQAMVEFALAVMVILYLIMGVVDFGRAFFAYNEVANVAREGARYATLTSHTDSQVISYAQGKFPLGGMSVTVTPSPRTAGSAVVVQATYSFSALTPLISNICCSGGSMTLTASSSMIVEQ